MYRVFFVPLLSYLLFWSHTCYADNHWTILPTECVAQVDQPNCTMEVQLSYGSLTDKEYCIALGNEHLGCWATSGLPRKLTVTLLASTPLVLKNKGRSVIASQTLSVKYLRPKTLRRRVRNPWSIF